MERIIWNAAGEPTNLTYPRILYQLASEDGDNPLLMDSVTPEMIEADSDGVVAFDALVLPYQRVERDMNILMRVMQREGDQVKPVAVQITKPFKNHGVVNVAAVFELSDGQTISVYLHNPDATPNKLAPTDDLISWKWLLNKKDVTIVVAPEHGKDLRVQEVARRLIKLAQKNSKAFARANERRATRMANIEAAKGENADLEKQLADLQHQIEVAQVELADKTKQRDQAKAAYEQRQAQAKAAQEEAARKAAEEAERKQQEEAERQADEEQPAAEDQQIADDKAVLQSIIDGTHPLMLEPSLYEVLEPIYQRYENKNAEMQKLADDAIEAWAKAADKATADIV